MARKTCVRWPGDAELVSFQVLHDGPFTRPGTAGQIHSLDDSCPKPNQAVHPFFQGAVLSVQVYVKAILDDLAFSGTRMNSRRAPLAPGSYAAAPSSSFQLSFAQPSAAAQKSASWAGLAQSTAML